ncbi:MAG: isoprenylcysteine carboxylmethyltransferase family protein [Terracidiphilus sp.]
MPNSLVKPTEAKAAPSRLSHILMLAKGMLAMALWVVAVFAGAGRLDWVRGWVFLGVYALVMMAIGTLLKRVNPELAAARARFMHKDTAPFDRTFLWIYFPLTFFQISVAGLDAVRFQALPLPEWTLLPGIVVFVAAMAMITWSLLANPFAEATVRIQSDRGQSVVSTGPYHFVRHPMYVGFVLMSPATALILGSGWAMEVAALMMALVVWRTAKEDSFLRRELPGYQEYAALTRFRLVPGLW